MPAVVKTIKETTQAITRPVVIGVLKSLKEYTGIANDVEIQAFTGSNAAPNAGSVLGAGNGDNVRFDNHEKLFCEYTEEYEEDNLLTTPINWRDNIPYFDDPRITTSIRPIIAKAKVTLSIRYRCPNESMATQWLADIRQRISMERAELPLEFSYSYQIPKAFLVILAHLHELRENVAGYNETFVEWLRDCFDERVTSEATMGDKAHQFSVAERQGGVLGWFDFTNPPVPDRNDSNTTWSISFSFTFIYDKAISSIMNYPIIVHNQLIRRRFHKKPTPYTLTEDGIQSITRTAGQRLPYTQAKPFQPPLGGIVLPSYDDWFPSTLPKYTSSLFTTLVAVDPEDPFQICNLQALGNWQLNPVMLDWIKRNRKECLFEYRSPLLISFYTGAGRYTREGLYIDDQLNLRTVDPMDLRKVHHLRIAMLVDLTVLSEPYQRKLRLDGHACLQFLRILDNTLEARGLLPRLRGGKMVAAEDYDLAVREILTTDPVYKTRPEYRRLTVGQFILYTGDNHANL